MTLNQERFTTYKSLSPVRRTRTTAEAHEMKILIAEDNIISRKMLQRILSKYGNCDFALNGIEAVEAFREAMGIGSKYDLICMDIMMPVMDGHEAIQNIRDIETTTEINDSDRVKIIMTSALDDMGNVLKAVHFKSNAYIKKPIRKETVENCLCKLGLLVQAEVERPKPRLNPYQEQRLAKNVADKSILVVDDHPVILDIIQVMLRNNDYRSVITADSGVSALRIMESLQIRAVITDWIMPYMTGIELLTHLKTDEKYFTVPVIMISGDRSSDKVLYAAEEGVDGFLVKPFNERDLINSVKSALEKYTSKDETDQKILRMRQLKLSNDYEKALETGLEIIETRKDPRVILMICECLYYLKQYNKAISMLAVTEDKDQTSRHAHLLGKIYLSMGKLAEGILALEKAIKMNVLNNDLKIDLAMSCFSNGKFEEGEAIIDGIVKGNPTDLNLVNIANIYLERNDIDKTGNYLKRTIQPIKETIPVFNNYAVALRKANRYDEAAEIYLKCIKIDPNSDALHFNIAVMYMKTGNLEEAKKAVDKSLKLNPDHEDAKKLLARLKIGIPAEQARKE